MGCKSKYNNCDPETVDNGDEYCLFHKPDKNKEEARKFYDKLKENGGIKNGKTSFVFDNSINWSGYVFPENIPDENLFLRIPFLNRG